MKSQNDLFCRGFLFVSVLIIAASVLPVVDVQPVAAFDRKLARPADGTIKGSVTDACTGEPIGDARIKTDGSGAALTLENGIYVMCNPPGTYALTAETEGYEVFTAWVSLGAGEDIIQMIAMLPTERGTYYKDADGDGYGDPSDSTRACTPPAGYVEDSMGCDCDDNDNSIHPGVSEICDGTDHNCDGKICLFGDIDGNESLDLQDAILGLKILVGADIGDQSVNKNADVNQDGIIGLPEVIRILKNLAGTTGKECKNGVNEIFTKKVTNFRTCSII